MLVWRSQWNNLCPLNILNISTRNFLHRLQCPEITTWCRAEETIWNSSRSQRSSDPRASPSPSQTSALCCVTTSEKATRNPDSLPCTDHLQSQQNPSSSKPELEVLTITTSMFATCILGALGFADVTWNRNVLFLSSYQLQTAFPKSC